VGSENGSTIFLVGLVGVAEDGGKRARQYREADAWILTIGTFIVIGFC